MILKQNDAREDDLIHSGPVLPCPRSAADNISDVIDPLRVLPPLANLSHEEQEQLLHHEAKAAQAALRDPEFARRLLALRRIAYEAGRKADRGEA